MVALRAVFRVGGVKLFGVLVVLDALAMVDEGADGQPAGELRHAAGMVLVKMRDQEVVDSFDAGVLGGRGDAIGVPAVVAGPTGVDQHGFAGGRHEQRGLAAFDVDEVYFKILGGGEQGGAHGGQEDDRECAHGLILALRGTEARLTYRCRGNATGDSRRKEPPPGS